MPSSSSYSEYFHHKGAKKPQKRVAASLLSILSGNPDKQDVQHRLIDSYIENGRYARNIQAFSIPCERNNIDGEPYDTIWVKSPHGAYTLVRTEIPINVKGEILSAPGYAVMFSQHPAFLADLFLRKADPDRVEPSPEEIRSKLTVLQPVLYEHDILQKNTQNGAEHVVTSWVKTAIDEHTNVLQGLLKRHGSLIKDNNYLLRSGSSVLWLNQSNLTGEDFECHHYSNPHFGQSRLFIQSRVLRGSVSGLFFKTASIKLDIKGQDREQAYVETHKHFARIARGIIRHEDPYDIYMPDTLLGKIKFLGKKIGVRSTQRVAHAVANINYKAFFLTAGISGALVAVTKLPTLLFAATTGAKANVILKGGQAASRAVSKFLSPVKPMNVNVQNDVSPLLAAHVEHNLVSEEKRGLIAHPGYIKHMQAVPLQLMANTFPDIVPYDENHEIEWAKSVLLDTLGFQPGTIFSEVDLNGRKFLHAEQPNGLDVYYDPEELVSFAHKVREPFPHTCLEKPIQKLFDTLPAHHDVIGIRHGQDGVLEHITFESIDNIPDDFLGHRSHSLQELRKNNLDIEFLGPPKNDFSILDVLPPKEREKVKHRAPKELTKHLRAVFEKEAPVDKIHHGNTTLDDRVHQYCRSNYPEPKSISMTPPEPNFVSASIV